MRYVIGDIHGNYQALKSLWSKLDFDYETDQLICLGDYVDGHSDCIPVINHLIEVQEKSKIKPIYILGNHDVWLRDFFETKIPERHWLTQGGQVTFEAYNTTKLYGLEYEDLIKKHHTFLKELKPYAILEDNYVFVHGGYYEQIPLEENPTDILLWDRALSAIARNRNITLKIGDKEITPKKVFIGHTAIDRITGGMPLERNNLINLDTGAGGSGKLSAYCIETEEIFQS